MMTTPLKRSVQQPRFGRRGGTGVSPVGIRAHFARDVLADMKAAYFADDRPWVVGFSGGKDSTALVQLLYYMLARLAAAQRRKHVYALASHTRVEAPYIAARIRKELETLQAAAQGGQLGHESNLRRGRRTKPSPAYLKDYANETQDSAH